MGGTAKRYRALRQSFEKALEFYWKTYAARLLDRRIWLNKRRLMMRKIVMHSRMHAVVANRGQKTQYWSVFKITVLLSHGCVTR